MPKRGLVVPFSLPILAILSTLLVCASSQTARGSTEFLAEEQAHLGISLYLQERYEVARDLLAGAREMRPEDARIARYALFADFHAGSLEDEEYAALQETAQAEGAAPLDRLLYAEASYLRRERDEAWMGATALLGEMEENPYLLILLSRLHGDLGDAKGRRRLAERAYSLAPEDAVAASGWARVLVEGGETEAAESVLLTALDAWPAGLDLNMELHRLLLSAAREEEAGELLERARAMAPDRPAVREALASAAEREGRFEDWIALRRTMLEDEPGDSQARWQLAEAYLSAGRSEMARALIEEGLVARPDDRQLASALGWVETEIQARQVAAEEASPGSELPEGEGGDLAWAETLEVALEQAREPRRVVLAYLPGEERWGRRMEETFEDPDLLADLAGAVPLRLEERPEGEELDLRPAVWFLDPEGRVVKRAPGYRSPVVLRDDLAKALEIVEEEKTALAAPGWFGSVEYAIDRARETGRQVVMDIYTDWCGPCKEMEKSTFADPDLITTLDSFFVPLKLNPELNEQEGADWDPRSYPTNYLVSGAGLILKEIHDRSPAGYAEELGAEKELALLERIGPEAYEERQARRRMLERMMRYDMYRSARAEAQALIDVGEEGLYSTLARACEGLGEDEAAAAAYLAHFDAEEEPFPWALGQAVRAEGLETPEARDARYEELARRYRGRPVHEAAVWLNWASELQGRGEREEALEAFEKSRRLHDGSWTRMAEARVELEMGHFERAAELLEPEAEDATSMEIMLAAITAEELGREEEAGGYYAAAAEADENVARQAYWSGRQAEREAQMPRLTDSEDSADSEVEEPVFTIDAARWYLTAARLAPDEPSFLNDLGYHMAEQGVELDMAVELLRRAVALGEEEEGEADPNTLDSLAWALHRRGDHEEALEVMKRCLRLGGLRIRLSETSCYHLGAIYGALGLTGLACEELQKVALAEEPDEEDQSEKAVAWRLLQEYRGEASSPGS